MASQRCTHDMVPVIFALLTYVAVLSSPVGASSCLPSTTLSTVAVTTEVTCCRTVWTKLGALPGSTNSSYDSAYYCGSETTRSKAVTDYLNITGSVNRQQPSCPKLSCLGHH
jgi:hypothetical protein